MENNLIHMKSFTYLGIRFNSYASLDDEIV